jgi:hypothetical protein
MKYPWASHLCLVWYHSFQFIQHITLSIGFYTLSQKKNILWLCSVCLSVASFSQDCEVGVFSSVINSLPMVLCNDWWCYCLYMYNNLIMAEWIFMRYDMNIIALEATPKLCILFFCNCNTKSLEITDEIMSLISDPLEDWWCHPLCCHNTNYLCWDLSVAWLPNIMNWIVMLPWNVKVISM